MRRKQISKPSIYTMAMTDSTAPKTVRFTGHRALIHRLVLATLTGRPVRISEIRSSSHTNPGLLPHEVSFLRLLEAVTNGSHIELSYTGTILLYRPGLITGSAAGHGASGGVIRHEVPAECSRGISFFLLPLGLLAPFSKSKFDVLFTGPGVITSAVTEKGDISADTVRTAILPLFAQFGIMANLELRIHKRSAPGQRGKGGGGEVELVFGHQVRLPKTLHLINPGRVKKIEGVAYAVGLPGANNQRMIHEARGILNPLVPNTSIWSDVTSAPFITDKAGVKKKAGVGFGISLVAESSTGCRYSADVASPPEGGETPEEIGKRCAYQLLESIASGGCVSPVAAPTMLTLMAMGSEDVGRLQLGRNVIGSEEIIGLGRDLNAFGASAWGLRDAGGDSEDVIVTVVGRGVGNVGRKVA